jgi:hypothetical protein
MALLLARHGLEEPAGVVPMRAARAIMYAAAAGGVFLAFAWPLVFGADPSSEAFHGAAVATLVVLLLSIAAVVAMKR